MKLSFQGWSREMTIHQHKVGGIELLNKRYRPAGELVTWHSALSARGKVTNLALNGSFLVTFNFEENELTSWLTAFAKEKPEEALRIIATAQAEALIALSKVQQQRTADQGER